MPNRTVVPEWLDQLPPQDPKAVASRRDLRRLNFWMGNARIIRTVLAELCRPTKPAIVAELGAGDGTFFLRVARLLRWRHCGAKVYLVDRHPSVSAETCRAFAKIGWEIEIIEADVFDWLPAQPPLDVLVANLFLHHFEPFRLTALFRLISQSARALVACEPRRCAPALGAGCMLGLLGCNSVTRHDAPISVRGGFRAGELSAAWPAPGWKLREERAGLFSHLFSARNSSP
jgi:hypothetical protein